MRLLPKEKHLGWVTYIWLGYLVFFFSHPVLNHVGWKEWVATGLGTAAFLACYFGIFWVRPPWTLVPVAGMVLLGTVFAPFNGGAAGFFIYAAVFIPFAVTSERAAIKLLAVLLAIIALDWWLLHLSNEFLFIAAFVSTFVGGANVFFAQRNRAIEKLRLAREEVEHLAKVAERERIARDLHDVLGHTLSVIILKSELAGKLIGFDPARARAEIGDVERISRAALADVRNTIRGYRSHSLIEEMKQAEATLQTAGVLVETSTRDVPLNRGQESVVALVVREAVTNVVRHAHARHCKLRLEPINGSCVLEIEDDGHGGAMIEGNGLRGMRERIEALGGTLIRETTTGTKLSIQFPLTQSGAEASD